MMIIAPPIISNAWTTAPSGPGRHPSSTAQNVVLQKSISAGTSRHTNIGIMTKEASGIGFTLSISVCPRKYHNTPASAAERTSSAAAAARVSYEVTETNVEAAVS